ncbi:MAG: 1,4-dihydroxy-2-naphthoate octaprenyltransferase [candidate division Zixibacteria bacterium RBG_16_50_21]|nr:MAG: 1,4-dihydroxy-2-naphthoate octaprenyltransferase [candidate division Zixibacteria bacterium RBG_16_50_21]
MQAVRAFSFTASMTPVLLGGMLALTFDGEVAWRLYPIVIICSLLYHAATNLISDYFDFKRQVDRDYTFGSSRVLVEGLLTPKQILAASWLLFGIATALGFILIAERGFPMLVLGVVGLLGGYLYTGNPVGYKYVALGDFLVFTLMGPLMVIGSYFALTGSYSSTVLFASLPIGFLVAAILHANNTRDIIHDAEAKVKTLANILGHRAAKVEYYVLVFGAYLSIIIMVFTKTISPWSLLVLLSLPPALKNIKAIAASQPGKPENIAILDVQTAQLHLLFGLLFSISLILQAIIS